MPHEQTLSTDRGSFTRFEHAVTGEYRTLLRAQVPDGKVWTIPEDREVAAAIPQIDNDTVPDGGNVTVTLDPDGIRVPWMDDPIADNDFTSDAFIVVVDTDNNEVITGTAADNTAVTVDSFSSTDEFVQDVTVSDNGNNGGVNIDVWSVIRAGKVRLARRTSGDGRSMDEVQNESQTMLGLSNPYDPDFRVSYASQDGVFGGVFPAGYKFDVDYFGDNLVEVRSSSDSDEDSDPQTLIVDLPIASEDHDDFVRRHPEADASWSVDDLRREVARTMQ